MKFKIFLIIILIISLTLPVNAGYLEDYNITPYNDSTEITFQNINFIIPEGFGEYEDSAKAPDIGSSGDIVHYMNMWGGKISIAVVSDFLGMTLDDLKVDGAFKTKINNHNGWKYTKEDLHYFSYVVDDKGIIIGVTNETRLNEIIV